MAAPPPPVVGHDATPLKPGTSLVLIGDSHQRKLAEYLTTTFKGLSVRYVQATGVYAHPTSATDTYLNCTDAATTRSSPMPVWQMSGGDGVLAGVDETCRHLTSHLANKTQQRLAGAHGDHDDGSDAGGDDDDGEDIPWVVVEAGHWDLRDSSVEQYRLDFTSLLAALENCRVLRGRAIVRTAPAYAHKRDLWAHREYRTNAKLAAAARFVRDELALHHPSMLLLDSFAMTFARFREACDTHHYICAAHGVEVDSTVPVLLGLVGAWPYQAAKSTTGGRVPLVARGQLRGSSAAGGAINEGEAE